MAKRTVRRARDGTFQLKLTDEERDLVASLTAQLRELLLSDQPDGVERLFPPGYANDEERQTEYQLLTHDELLQTRLAAIDLVEQSVTSPVLTADEVNAWMAAVNSLRLVLGTRLDVPEDVFAAGFDPGAPDAYELAVYAFLTWLQEAAVEAASGAL